LSSLGVETGASGGLPAARCTSNAFLCTISARCGNQQKKRYAFMDLFHLGWRDSLSIKNPAFWCIYMSAPPAFIGSSNATWVVSENHRTAPAAFREPLPSS
jgi:hypothetical protein